MGGVLKIRKTGLPFQPWAGKIIEACLVSLFAVIVSVRPAHSGTECDGTVYNGAFYPKGKPYYPIKNGVKYECYACGGCRPLPSWQSSSAFPGGSGSTDDLAKTMAAGLLENMIRTALAPPQDGAALEEREALEQARKEAEEQAEKKKRQAKFKELQAKNADRQKQDNDTLVSLLGGGDSASADDTLSPIDRSSRKKDRDPGPRTGKYLPPATVWQRLLCASSFSKQALDAAGKGDELRARYLSEQAEKAMSGKMLEVECTYDRAPDVPEPSRVGSQEDPYQGMIVMVQRDIEELGAIDGKLHELESRRKGAEEKKKQAERRITDDRTPAAGKEALKEKQKIDDLTLQARKLLKESEEELAALDRDEKALLDRQQEIKGRLKEVRESLRRDSGRK